MVTASVDHTARVWEAASGELIVAWSAPPGLPRRVYSAAFSPDVTRVVTASVDKTARVWEADSGKLVVRLDTTKNGSTRPPSAPTPAAW